MLGLAVFQLLLMALTPAFIAAVIYCRKIGERVQRVRNVLAWACIMFSVPAWLSCVVFWPFDWLLPSRNRECYKETVIGYTVQIAQRPGPDFYETFAKITRDADQQMAIYCLSSDDLKLWKIRRAQIGSR